MNKRINFDVVIPAHNAADSIVEAVQSAWQQRRAPSSVTVVADACDDDTATLARAAGAQVVEINARSVAVARNRGAEAGLSAWIAFLDADDYWYPGWLDAVAGQIRHDAQRGVEAALYYGQVIEREANGLLLPRTQTADNRRARLSELLTRSMITTSASVIARQTFLSIGGFDPQYSHGEDWDLWLRAAERWAVAPVAGLYVEYRLSPMSAMRDPRLFARAREQSLHICRSCLRRNDLTKHLKDQSLSYVYQMSAERFLRHGFVAEARRDLRQALARTPLHKKLWAMLGLSVLHPADRARLLALRRALRRHAQKI